jgi:hypothetical protein
MFSASTKRGSLDRDKTRFVRRTAGSPSGAILRLSLFAASLSKENALELLSQLAPPWHDIAQSRAKEVLALDSASRQSMLAREFGEREEAGSALEEWIEQAGPTLRRAIFDKLPLYHRTRFPELQDASREAPAPTEAVAAFAERLVKEALR